MFVNVLYAREDGAVRHGCGPMFQQHEEDRVFGRHRELVCKSYVENSTLLSLPPQVDNAWHQAILNTRLYQGLCDDAFGRMMHHTTTTASDPIEDKNHRIASTDLIYQKRYREEPPADLWEREHSPSEPEEEEASKTPDVKVRRNPSRKVQKKRAASSDVPLGAPEVVKREKSEIPSQPYQVFGKALNGKTMTFQVLSHLPVAALKALVQLQEGIPSDQQRIIFSGRNLVDNELCWESGLRVDQTFHLVLRVSGC